jgi:transcriptional regulator with XRE-family HTH domain
MTDFPDALKVWRRTRRFSQLDLAAEANVSARHIAFLETGRARPSPAMIGRLGEALQIPLAARNQMLTLAGFATRYPARQWDASEMAPIRAALEHTLEQHAPYPGIAIDRMWTVVRLNRPAQGLFGQLGMAEGSSMLDLMASDALPPLIENWPEVAHHAAQRLRTESAAQGGVAKLDRLAEKLAAVPGGSGKPIGPVTPTIYRTGTMRLSLFAIIAQFGTPEDLALDDLKIELFFPADSETEQALRSMSAEP